MPRLSRREAIVIKPLILLVETLVGAGGGTRTRTTFYGPGILSPVRLPFRHTGYA